MPVVWRRLCIFVLALAPLGILVVRTLRYQLGADPAQAIVAYTGEWAFYFLCITLLVTPLRRLVNAKRWHFRWLQVHRRMLGLFTLFYALLHVSAYFVFILGSDVSRFGAELIKRPYIVVTIPAIILLVLLGVTSTQGMMRRLGKYWLRLHQSIYLIAVLAWIHVFWQVRSSYTEAALFGIFVLFLLGIRLYWFARKPGKSSISS